MGQTTTVTASEQERAEAFAALGFDATQSLVLAATQNEGEHVDLELVERLVRAGCSHELALRIVL